MYSLLLFQLLRNIIASNNIQFIEILYETTFPVVIIRRSSFSPSHEYVTFGKTQWNSFAIIFYALRTNSSTQLESMLSISHFEEKRWSPVLLYVTCYQAFKDIRIT